MEHIRIPKRVLGKYDSVDSIIDFLLDLEDKGVIEYGSIKMGGPPGFEYFDFNMEWPESDPADAIMYKGRPAETLEECMKALYTPDEARKMLNEHGFEGENLDNAIDEIYNPTFLTIPFLDHN